MKRFSLSPSGTKSSSPTLFPVLKSKIRYQNRHDHKLSYLVTLLDFIFPVPNIGDDCMNLSRIS